MNHFEERYINPFTDFGFKKLFGEEPNKALLLDFLNTLLKEQEGEIKSLTYLKNEHLDQDLNRRAIFDLYCENERGEKFIVELQKTKQQFFKDRTLYYSTFPIREQAKRADWNYELKSVYTIAILDFVFDQGKDEPHKYRYDVKLMDEETCRVFYDKLTFIYLEMPKFKKPVEALETHFDKWLYVLKNLNRLDRVPERLRERIFEQLFETAEIAKLDHHQLNDYEDSLKYYRDLKNSLDTSFDEGMEKGKKEGIKEGIKEGMEKGKKEGKKEEKYQIAQNLLGLGLDYARISQATGLTPEEIKKIEQG